MPSVKATIRQRIPHHPTAGYVAGHIAGDPTPPPKRVGRKSKAELAERPYTVAARADTGRFFMSYTGCHPETGEVGRHKLPLIPEGQGNATTYQDEAERLAAAIWLQVRQRAAERRRGEKHSGLRSFAALAPLYCAHVLSDTTRRPVTNARMVKEIQWVMKNTWIGQEADLRTLTEKSARNLLKTLRETLYPPSVRKRKPHLPSGDQCAFTLRQVMYFLEWVRQEHIPGMPNVIHSSKVLKALKRPKRDAHHFYTPIEVAAILRAAHARPERRNTLGNAEILDVDFYTGCRSTEGTLLRPQDVDFEKGTIRLVTAKSGRYRDGHREWFDVEGPTDVDRLAMRTLRMWPRLHASLWAYFQRYRIRELNWPWVFPDYAAPGFRLEDPSTHRRRTKGPYSFLRTAIKDAQKELPDLSFKPFHVARHTYISARRHMFTPTYDPHTGIVKAEPVSLAQIQSEVGHADNSPVTMRVYNKVLYHIPPNTEYDLDWEVLARVCMNAAEARREKLRKLPSDMVARYQPVASHSTLLQQVEPLSTDMTG